MKTLIAAVVTVLLGITGATAATQPVQVTLSLHPARTLPGLSVPFTLKIKNSGAPIHLAPAVSLRFTSTNAEPFLVEWYQRRNFGPLDLGTGDHQPLVISMNEVVELSVPAFGLDDPTWIFDNRLLEKPGTWKVEALLYDVRDANDAPPVAVSSPVTLTIDAPSERDLPIWQALLRGDRAAIAEKVFTEQPESPYAPYLAPLIRRVSPLEKIAILRHAIELQADSPVVPWLRLQIAQYYVHESQHSFDRDDDIDKAMTYSEKAREELLKLGGENDPWSKLTSKRQLDEVPGRPYFVDLHKIKHENGGSSKP